MILDESIYDPVGSNRPLGLVKIWLCAIVALTAIVLNGCAPTRKLTSERSLSVAEVIRRVQQRDGRINTLTGDGTITVETPQASNSGSFDLRLKKPDSLLVNFSGPFGINVGTLLLSREQFIFYNRMENKAVIGKPDGETLESMFRLRMHFDEVLNAFLGEFPTQSQDDSIEKFYVQDGLYVLKFHTNDGTKEYRIDGDEFVVRSYRVLDQEGRAALIALASQLDEASNITMPTLLRVIFPKERRSMTVAYDDIEINQPVVCSFSLPKQAEVIHR